MQWCWVSSFLMSPPRNTYINHCLIPSPFGKHIAMMLSSTTTTRKRGTSKAATTGDQKGTVKKTKMITSSSSTGTVPWYHVFTKGDEEYNQYMATEWGFEKRGDVPLFEKICLEGAQSGLSWQTILKKRKAYQRTFYGFDPHKVAAMTSADVQRILDTTTETPTDMIVRHKGKIEATITNAKCLLQMQKEDKRTDALDAFLWSFVNDQPILNTEWGADFDPNTFGSIKNAPSKSPESEAMSKALKAKGWKFVGPTTCYAMMQSCGMVIDHPLNSPEWQSAKQRLLQRKGGFQERTTTQGK
jgi:DNA-3-methyladenine glycosylase I